MQNILGGFVILKKVYNEIIIKKEKKKEGKAVSGYSGKVILDGETFDADIGKHSIWIPAKEMKFPFHYNGHFVEYLDWERGQHAESIKNHEFNLHGFLSLVSLYNIVEEYLIFDSFSKSGFSPSVNDFFYTKNLISDFPYGILRCDPIGAYGFYFKDANKLDKKKFNNNIFKELFIDTGFLQCSLAALNDITLSTRDNHINGYIIDIRRSIQDAIHFGLHNVKMLDKTESTTKALVKQCNDLCSEYYKMIEKIGDFGQFPFKQRKLPYQSFRLGKEIIKGARDILYRFERLYVPENLTGKTVLDLGCCIGGASQECYVRGARKITGLDNQKEYIECARDIARYNRHQINYMVYDLTKPKKVIKYVNDYYKEAIDIVFALALYKHIGNNLWEILDNIKFKTLYVESSSVKDENTPHMREVDNQLKKRYRVTNLGYTEDRSKRAIWKADCV